ncbi:MAG: glycosyltransferase family 4 protein [Nitrososphaerota archaeon]|nr:glycosyltransferase family 4 protein [Nitrososphaerota archaeon]
MRIAQVNVYFQPFMVGGAEWYVYNVSKELVKRGHEVHVFTAARLGGTAAPESETIDGISVHRIPLSLDWSYRMKVWDGLHGRLEGGKFDVIHAYDYAQPHSAVAVKAGAASKTPTVLTVFDVHSMIPRKWYKQLPMKFLERYWGRRTLPGATAVLVRAPNLVDPVVKLGAAPERVKVTSSGVRDESMGTFDGGGFRARHGMDGSPLVLYVGRMNPLKGPQYLIKAAPTVIKALPGTRFAFVGPDQSGYQETLREMADRLGVGSNVQFLGPIYDFDEKMSAYAACDIFALPTSYEGTSQSIFEAMAQARPVVSTHVGGVPYQLTDGVEGRLVPFGDVDALSSAITGTLADKGLAARMGESGRKRVEPQRYSLLVSELERIYGEAAN